MPSHSEGLASLLATENRKDAELSFEFMFLDM
jgi:hypothetical protein